jgi:hypothetical protein
VAAFAEVMATPPRTTPPDLRARLEAQTQSVIRSGAWYSGFAALAWFLFLPPLLAIGIRRFDYAVVIAAMAALSAALSFTATRQRPIRRPIQCAALTAIFLAGAAASRLYGPLILMPTVFTGFVIVMQTSPDAFMRVFSLIVGQLLMLAPLGLELAGVLPSSYASEDGKLVVLPQMVELPALGTYGFLALANVASGLVSGLFVARLRAELTGAQQRELLRAYRLRRLPEELMRASPR